MAKTIKFNLIIDEKPIRDIKGLQENFVIDDMLELYQNGLLQKWLKVRGFDDYLKKVESIDKNKSVIMQLIEIFNISKSDKDIKEAIYSLEFWEERKLALEKWTQKEEKTKKIIADYHNGYDVLMQKIFENKEDMPFMKSAAKEIYDKYLGIFKIDYPFFFERFNDEVPIIIYAVLMNNNMRNFFLDNEDIKNKLQSKYTLSTLSKAKNTIYSKFEIFNNRDDENYNETQAIEKIMEKIKLHTFKGATDGYWKDLEVKGTKVMVLYIPAGTFIRNSNKPKEELSTEEVNGKFLLLNGLVYKSNTAQSSIVYMEV